LLELKYIYSNYDIEKVHHSDKSGQTEDRDHAETRPEGAGYSLRGSIISNRGRILP
jgi:hypothetical protein